MVQLSDEQARQLLGPQGPAVLRLVQALSTVTDEALEGVDYGTDGTIQHAVDTIWHAACLTPRSREAEPVWRMCKDRCYRVPEKFTRAAALVLARSLVAEAVKAKPDTPRADLAAIAANAATALVMRDQRGAGRFTDEHYNALARDWAELRKRMA